MDVFSLYEQALENRRPDFLRKVENASVKKREHGKLKSPKPLSTCPACQKTFSRIDHRDRHIRTSKEEKHIKLAVMMDEKLPANQRPIEIRCPVCQSIFTRADHLYRHIRQSTDESHARLAPKVNKIHCAECDRTFKRKEGLTIHQRTHHELPTRLEVILKGSGKYVNLYLMRCTNLA